MNSGINLLGNKKKASSMQSSPRLRLLRKGAILLLFSISCASIILFILITFSPLPALQKQEEQAIFQMTKRHTDIAKLILVNDRLTGSSKILASRPDFAKAIDAIKKIMPGGVDIVAVNLIKNSVSVTVESKSLVLIDTFFTNLISVVNAKKDFSQLTLTNFFFHDQKDSYAVTVTVTPL